MNLPKPSYLPPDFAAFPEALTAFPQWVLWKAALRDGKWTKPLYRADSDVGGLASSTDPATWTSFCDARDAYLRGGFDGVGFVLSDSDPFTGIDLDDAYVSEDGEPTADARALLDLLDSYTERSPSGKGFRVFVRANLPPDGRKKADFECYESGRYLTVTGARRGEYPASVEARQEATEEVHRRIFPPSPAQAIRNEFRHSQASVGAAKAAKPSLGLLSRKRDMEIGDDAALLARAFQAKNGPKIAALYGGDCSAYPGASEADIALCACLAFYTGDDAGRLDRLFRAGGLWREKWDERHYANGDTYGQRTIQKAIAGCADFFGEQSAPARADDAPPTETPLSRPRETETPPVTASPPATVAPTGGDEGDEPEVGRGPSVATRLMEIARERCELWHTAGGVTYITDKGGKRETRAVESTAFRRFLADAYIGESGKAPAPSAIQSAILSIDAIASRGPETPVYTRKADCGDTLYFDLGGDDGKVVKVTAEGWQVIDDCPVRFRRTKGMMALPCPVRGGNIAELRPFVNAPSSSENSFLSRPRETETSVRGVAREADEADQFTLMVAWLLAALGPSQPYPILSLAGEQGTAKSTTARILRSLFDPANPDLRREPKEDRDLAIAATNGFGVCYDNLSALPLWLSDTLCCLSTGGGFGTRKLHSDDEETLFTFLSPVLLTGIGEASTRGDFLERCILLTLPVIPEERRRPEAEVKAEFAEASGRIFGALLDAIATGLKNLPTTRLDAYPRMADFARWVVACEPACPWEAGAFLEAYWDNQAQGVKTTLEGDNVAPLLLRLIDAAENAGHWEGTADALRAALANLAPDSEKKRLPGNARSLSVALRRIGPGLRNEGVTVDFGKSNGVKIITVLRLEAGSQNRVAKPETGSQSRVAKYPDSLENEIGRVARVAKSQNYPCSSSPHLLRKKGEIGGETGETGETGDEQGEEYNSGNFATLRPLRPLDEKSPENDEWEEGYLT